MDLLLHARPWQRPQIALSLLAAFRAQLGPLLSRADDALRLAALLA